MGRDEVRHGLIVKFLSCERNGVRSHFVILDMPPDYRTGRRKRSKNYLPFVTVSGLWYEHETNFDIYHPDAYGKGGSQLQVGHLNDMEAVAMLSPETRHLLD